MTLLPMKYKTKGKSIVVRTVRHGRVRINGYTFEPRDKPILPELDGKRCAFGIYWTGSRLDRHWQMENFVSLWGSEEMYQRTDEDDFDKAYDDWHKMLTDKNNFLRFHWWKLSRVQSVAFGKRRGILP